MPEERPQTPPGGVEGLGTLPDRQEHLLGHVLGGVAIPDHPGGEPEHVGAELVVEVGKRGCVTRDEAVPHRQLPRSTRRVDHRSLGHRILFVAVPPADHILYNSDRRPRIPGPGSCSDRAGSVRDYLRSHGRRGQIAHHQGERVSDLFSIEGKTALVTGGSRGIGAMIARGFVEAGATVYISSRKKDVCDEMAAELSKLGTCVSLPADLSTEAACIDLAAEIASRESRLHILVNNAGATWGAPLAEFPADAWDKVLDLNVKAPFFLTRALLPQLEAAATADDPARVINIGSIDAIQVPMLETYSYSSSKAAIHQLTRHLARNLGRKHITVNAIAPGPFESKMMAATLRDFGDDIARSSPLGRIGRPDDMAGAAIFLASRAGAYVTGAVLPVDGGIATTK